MTSTIGGAFQLAAGTEDWEPFEREDGVAAGEVRWLRVGGEDESVRYAGLWLHRPEDAPEGRPYNVSGSETFCILEGAIELTLPSGEQITAKQGDCLSFPDGFSAIWKTVEPFVKFFVVTA